jgi:hypothetical protein
MAAHGKAGKIRTTSTNNKSQRTIARKDDQAPLDAELTQKYCDLYAQEVTGIANILEYRLNQGRIALQAKAKYREVPGGFTRWKEDTAKAAGKGCSVRSIEQRMELAKYADLYPDESKKLPEMNVGDGLKFLKEHHEEVTSRQWNAFNLATADVNLTDAFDAVDTIISRVQQAFPEDIVLPWREDFLNMALGDILDQIAESEEGNPVPWFTDDFYKYQDEKRREQDGDDEVDENTDDNVADDQDDDARPLHH